MMTSPPPPPPSPLPRAKLQMVSASVMLDCSRRCARKTVRVASEKAKAAA
jgi:hypothetical protein